MWRVRMDVTQVFMEHFRHGAQKLELNSAMKILHLEEQHFVFQGAYALLTEAHHILLLVLLLVRAVLPSLAVRQKRANFISPRILPVEISAG